MRIADVIIERKQDHSLSKEEYQEEYQKFLQMLQNFSHGRGIEAYDDSEYINDVFNRYAVNCLQQKTVTYRGMNLDSWNDISDGFDFRTNGILHSHNILSTSKSRKVASDDYMKLDKFAKVFILFEFELDASTKCIDVNYYSDDMHMLCLKDAPADLDLNDEDAVHQYLDNEAVGSYTDDEEIILPANMEFKVLSKQQKPCTWSMDPKTWKHDPARAEYWEVKLKPTGGYAE